MRRSLLGILLLPILVITTSSHAQSGKETKHSANSTDSIPKGTVNSPSISGQPGDGLYPLKANPGNTVAPVTVLPSTGSSVDATNQTEMHNGVDSIKDDALRVIAQDVAARLGAHQKTAGYWLISYTQSEHFNNPQLEMNTFLTSMIVDILDPVAARAGLDENLARARLHLSDQIEANGLVRYHGRPDSPTIPSLGCVITPDADDTALVWRLAGNGKQALLPHVIEILKSYRTQEGLYRTWLAPRNQYVNIDPGEDPNPTDVGIQMNLLMFFAKFDAQAARALHSALQHAITEDRIWVYYKSAPLLPVLRAGDLRKLGYPLHLPQDRLQTPLPEQMVWVAVCQLLARYMANEEPPPSYPEILALIKTIAVDDFFTVRNNPPLFYHNDLTAKNRRFYWSEDFGYALWLRLYLENPIHHIDAVPTK